MADTDREITSGQAARILKCSQGTVQSLCEEGKLRAWRTGDKGWWRILYSSVHELLAERMQAKGKEHR